MAPPPCGRLNRSAANSAGLVQELRTATGDDTFQRRPVMTEHPPLGPISCQGVGGPCPGTFGRPTVAPPISRFPPVLRASASGRPCRGASGRGWGMAGTALVLVHGRSQQMPAAARRGRAEEVAFVAKKRQTWLGGLAKGLTLAGMTPIDTSAVYFPYYGNRFADSIAARERKGLPRPDLESGFEDGDDVVVERPPSADALILDSALLLGFAPDREALPGVDAGEQAELDEA